VSLEAIEQFLGGFPPEQDERKWLYHSILRGFYNWIAARRNYPPAALNFRLVTPSRSNKVRSSLSNDQVLQLLSLDMSAEDRCLIELILEAGPRVGEIISIQANSIQDGRIRIKGKTGGRIIQVGQDLENELKTLRSSPGPLFVSEDGKPLTPNSVYERIARHLERIGVTEGKRGPHMLRHTFGRLYLEHGGDLESLRQQLGHKRLATTSIYAELSPDQVRTRAMAASPLQAARRQLSEQYQRQYGDPDETAGKKHERESAKPLPGQIHMDQLLEEKAEENASD